MIDVDDKLLKIIELARQGVGGEKDTAQRIVRKRCSELGLSFEDVMNGTDYREYNIKISVKSKVEFDLITQVCFKFATTPAHPGLRGNQKTGVVWYVTTPGRHIETANAVGVYLKAFRAEHKRMMSDLFRAFLYKHKLYQQFKTDDSNTKEFDDDPEAAPRVAFMARNMNDVAIHKQLESGK